MNKVYLDNAATTQIREEVIREMVEVMTNDFGNPSSTHSFGRNAKNIIELCNILIEKHSGEVPNNFDDLISYSEDASKITKP